MCSESKDEKLLPLSLPSLLLSESKTTVQTSVHSPVKAAIERQHCPSLSGEMSTDPLRRVLFPTPRKNDDGASSRSIQRIRPKPELTPVNLESTPRTFRRLVENSPVPLAVAAAKAAMRAAQSARSGFPIMTEMTRAAEEVVKDSNYNAVRPLHLSPQPLRSPSSRRNASLLPSSASLPPVPSQTTRPAGALSRFRRLFMRQQQTRSWSSTPVDDDHTLSRSDKNSTENREEVMKAPESPTNTLKTRMPPFRQPNFVQASSEKRVRKPVMIPGKATHLRTKSDPLNRLFGTASPPTIANTTEIRMVSDVDRKEMNKTVEALSKRVASSGKQTKKRPRTLSRIEPDAIIPEDDANDSPGMRTRSAKRPRRAPKANNAVDHKDTKSKKRRRMSEVLKLQKALETAAWTNSVDVEKQTEVIVVSEYSPNRPRPDVSIKFENKMTPDKRDGSKDVLDKARQKISGVKKESKTKKPARSKEGKQTATMKGRRDSKTGDVGKRKANVAKGKGNSVKTSISKERTATTLDAEETANESVYNVKRKLSMKEVRENKRSRLRKLEAAVATEKQQSRSGVTAREGNDTSGVRQEPDRHVPLKKRLSPEKRREISSAEAVTSVSQPCADSPSQKMRRKSSNPKRLSAASKDAHSTREKTRKRMRSDRTRAQIAHTEASPQGATTIVPPSSMEKKADGLCSKKEQSGAPHSELSHPDVTHPEKSRPETRAPELKRSSAPDSEATLSETTQPNRMKDNI